MTKQPLGPKALQVRALRERRFEQAQKASRAAPSAEARAALLKKLTEVATSKPIQPPVQASAKPKETTMKKAKKKAAPAKKRGRSEAAANLKKAKAATTTKTPSGGVPATDVGDFICRDGGASMEELVANFGIEAHPMRAKIHRARHALGYAIETKDGRYTGTPPKAA